MKKTPVWISSNGRRTPITEMADNHLVNTIKMLDRAIPAGEEFCRTLSFFAGGADPEGLEHLEDAHRSALADAKRWREVLFAEAERRDAAKAAEKKDA